MAKRANDSPGSATPNARRSVQAVSEPFGDQASLPPELQEVLAALKAEGAVPPELGEAIEQAEEMAAGGDIAGAFELMQNAFVELAEISAEPSSDESEDPLSLALELEPGRQQWRLQTAKDTDTGRTVAAILDEQDQLVMIDTFDRSPLVEQLREFLLMAIAEPIQGPPRKPAALRAATKALVGSLQKLCETIGIECGQQQMTAREKQHLKRLMKMLAASEGSGGEATDIGQLPQRDETWLYGLFHPPLWIADRAKPRRGWFQLVADATAGTILGTDVTEQQPSPAEMAGFLRKTMGQPAVGDARRPQQCLLDPAETESLERASLREAGVAVGALPDGDVFTELIGDLLSPNGPTDQPLLAIDGVDAEALRRLYQACAEFYQAAPWETAPGDQFFELTCRGWRNSTWAACITGQMGQEFGLSLFEDLEFVRDIMETGQMDPGRMRSVIAHFQEDFEAIPVDVWNIERRGWKVAGPEAYPLIVRYNPGPTPVVPSAEDLQVLETALTHLPRLLGAPAGETLTLEQPHPDQPNPLTMRWIT